MLNNEWPIDINEPIPITTTVTTIEYFELLKVIIAARFDIKLPFIGKNCI